MCTSIIIEFPLNLKMKAHSLDKSTICRGSESIWVSFSPSDGSSFLNYLNTWVNPKNLCESCRFFSHSLFRSSQRQMLKIVCFKKAVLRLVFYEVDTHMVIYPILKLVVHVSECLLGETALMRDGCGYGSP